MSSDAQAKGNAMRHTRTGLLFAVVAFSAIADAPRPNILLVTVDTCRADRIGCYGYGLARTPTMDALAAEGVQCTDAVTTAPITMPAHASILTGLLPPAHGVRDNGAYALSDKAVTLAERLNDAGYDTAAFVSALVLNRRYNLTQGFDLYDDDLWAEDDPKLFMIRDRPAPKTAERVVNWLKAWHAKEDRAPFFLWVHFFDPHQPYESRVPDRHLIPTAYDAEIAQADDGLARIVDELKALGLDQSTFTVVTADHGESLGEHGEKTHAIFIYDATVRVPLIFHWPGVLPATVVYRGPVSCIDIMPTVLAGLNAEGGDETQGVNLIPALRGEAPSPESPQYSESLLSELGFGMAPLYGLRSKGYKWIRAPKPELYNLRTDPDERNNIYPENPDLAAQMDKQLTALLDDSKPYTLQADENPMDQETLEMLQALGYLADAGERSAMEGMDPKDGIELYTKLEDARHQAQRGNYAESEKLLRELLEVTPRHLSARNVLGLAVLRQGNLEGAEHEYRESLQIDPNQSRVQYMLGYIKLRQEQYEEAEQLYKRALEITPKFAEAMVHLGFIALQRDRQDEARQWYERALAIDPGFPRAHLAYADLHFVEGDYARALTYYQRVLATTPNHFAALLQAGLCAQRTGDAESAAKYFDDAQNLRPDSWIPSFNLACLKAVAGDPGAALALLESALEKVTGDSALLLALQSDPDLTSLRDRADFKALIHQAQAAIAATS
jgi:arylsulfatase A-like enzyme/Flp pilus assembly protein TadD